MTEMVPIIASVVSLLGSVIMALVAWGARAEIGTLRAEMSTMRAEVKASMAESALAMYRQINGSYVKTELYNTLVARIDGIENRVNDLGD